MASTKKNIIYNNLCIYVLQYLIGFVSVVYVPLLTYLDSLLFYPKLINDILNTFRQEETLTQETLRPLSEHLTELNSALQDQVNKKGNRAKEKFSMIIKVNIGWCNVSRQSRMKQVNDIQSSNKGKNDVKSRFYSRWFMITQKDRERKRKEDDK